MQAKSLKKKEIEIMEGLPLSTIHQKLVDELTIYNYLSIECYHIPWNSVKMIAAQRQLRVISHNIDKINRIYRKKSVKICKEIRDLARERRKNREAKK